MPDSLAAMLASIPDGGSNTAAEVRAIITALYNWIPAPQKYLMGRLPGETAHAADDFFTAYSGYTEQTPSGSVTWALGRGGLTVGWNSVGASDVAVAVKPIPVAGVPITIEMGIATAFPAVADIGMHLIFTDGTGATANFQSVAFVQVTAASNLYRMAGTLSNYTATLITGGTGMIRPAGALFLRLIWKSANVFAFAVSADGELWTDFNTADFGPTLTPTHMGFGVSSNNNTARASGLVHYLRVYEADLSA